MNCRKFFKLWVSLAIFYDMSEEYNSILTQSYIGYFNSYASIIMYIIEGIYLLDPHMILQTMTTRLLSNISTTWYTQHIVNDDDHNFKVIFICIYGYLGGKPYIINIFADGRA